MTPIKAVDSHTCTGRRWKSWSLCHFNLLATTQMLLHVSSTIKFTQCRLSETYMKLTLWFVSKLTGPNPSPNKLAFKLNKLGILAYP